jgi:hypothetical protein
MALWRILAADSLTVDEKAVVVGALPGEVVPHVNFSRRKFTGGCLGACEGLAGPAGVGAAEGRYRRNRSISSVIRSHAGSPCRTT